MSRPAPRFARALLMLMTAPEDRDFVAADLDARYRTISAESGDGPARRWYRSQVMRSIPSLLGDRMLDLRQIGLSGIGREFGRVLRRSVRSPLYSIGVAGTLALGLGSLAILGTLAWDVWLSPLPIPDPDRVVRIYEMGRLDPDTGLRARNRVSPPFLDGMQRHQWASISEVAGISGDSPEWTHESGSRVLSALRVTEEFFSVLGLTPTVGRLGWDDGQAQVIVSERFWRSAFGADPSLANGRSLNLNGEDHRVVGVVALPAGYPTPQDVLVPLRFRENQLSEGMRGARYMGAIARVAPGRTAADASAELAAYVESLGADHPQHAGWSGEAVILGDDLTSPVKGVFALLLGAGIAFLILAVVNVTGLVAARRVETDGARSIQRALGASSGRLLRDSLVEALFLGSVGALGGVTVAWLILPSIADRLPADLPRLDALSLAPLDAIGLTLAGVILSALIGLAGHLISPAGSLSATTRSVSAALGHRRWLIAGQVAITTVLLGGGLMMVREASGLRSVDMGFEPGEVHSVALNLPNVAFPDQAARLVFWEALLSGLKADGARATVVTNPTLSGSVMNYGFLPEGAENESFGQYHHIAGDYFELLSIDLIAGRTFLPSEEGPVIIINQAVADEHFGGEDPIGRTIRLLTVERTIVGVVASTRHFGPDQPTPAEIYVPLREDTWGFGHVLVENRGQAERLLATIAALAPGIEPPPVTPYSDRLAEWFAPLRLQLLIIGLLSAIGMLLAGLGLYAAIAWQVGARAREIGIRLALGAPRVDVFGKVVRQGATLALLGALAGLAVWSIAWGRLAGVLKLDDSPSLLVALSAVGIVVVVSLLAVTLPALQSTRVDPAASLRRD